MFGLFFFEASLMQIMQKERHKITYKPNHEFSQFALICDKLNLANVLGGQYVKRPIVVAEKTN